MDTIARIFSTFNICQLTLSVGLSVCQCPVDVPAGRPTGRPEAHGRRRRPAGAPRTDGWIINLGTLYGLIVLVLLYF